MSGELGTLGADERCQRCGGENVAWAAPSPLWNFVMRGNDIDGDPIWGDLVCIRCFIVLAEAAGVRGGRWRVNVDPSPDALIYETPSGRVWDADRWLWVEPNTDAAEPWEPWEKEHSNHAVFWTAVHHATVASDERCARIANLCDEFADMILKGTYNKDDQFMLSDLYYLRDLARGVLSGGAE